MSTTTAQPDSKTVAEQRADALADELESLGSDYVVAVKRELKRAPPRVFVHLAEGSIPDAVRDRTHGEWARDNHIDADLVDAKTLGDDLVVIYEVRARKETGTRTLRDQAGSKVITLTQESRTVSGFEDGDKVNQSARDGVIILKRYEDTDGDGD